MSGAAMDDEADADPSMKYLCEFFGEPMDGEADIEKTTQELTQKKQELTEQINNFELEYVEVMAKLDSVDLLKIIKKSE